MLAARDQENLVHGYQAAAASKPLNQGSRQAPPKTPGNKAYKTAFKIPLNDENGRFGAGKAGLNLQKKGNENTFAIQKGGLGDKNEFVTPMAQRNRAPLGMKTTNAKAKALQTPGIAIEKEGEKVAQKSASARKARPKVSHAESTKLNILADTENFEEREIEYAPPPVKGPKQYLPDYPDDFPPLDLSVLEGGTHGQWAAWNTWHRIRDDGLTLAQRRVKDREEQDDRDVRRQDAKTLYHFECITWPCCHTPECPEGECESIIEVHKAAKIKYDKTIAEINAEEDLALNGKKKRAGSKDVKMPPLQKGLLPTSTIARPKVSKAVGTPSSSTTIKKAAPSASTSRLAPASLAKTQLNTTLTSRPKKPSPIPTNPSSMRHHAATAASKTTIGYSKGRATSASLQMHNSRAGTQTHTQGKQSMSNPTTARRFATNKPDPFLRSAELLDRNTSVPDEFKDNGAELQKHFYDIDDPLMEDAQQEFKLVLLDDSEAAAE